jgi:hypothetical protein
MPAGTLDFGESLTDLPSAGTTTNLRLHFRSKQFLIGAKVSPTIGTEFGDGVDTMKKNDSGLY